MVLVALQFLTHHRKSCGKPGTAVAAGSLPSCARLGRARAPVPHKHKQKVRHRRSTAHERARYRCFLPDLAGLAGKRRAEPMPDSTYYQDTAENRNGQSRFSIIIKSRHDRAGMLRL